MSNKNANSLNQQVKDALLHEMWHSDGRVDALRFAWDCGGRLEQISTRIIEVEDQMYNPPPALKDRMEPGASTRVYQDGYLEGLKNALAIIEQAVNGVEREVAATWQA